MEKRLLISFILSFLVLFGWNALNPPPSPVDSPALEEKATTGTAPVSEAETAAVGVAGRESVPEDVLEQEQVSTFEDEYLRVEASNLGGVITNIHIKEYDTSLPVTAIADIPGYTGKIFNARRLPRGVEFTYVGTEGTLIKRFELSKQGHVVDIKVHSKTETSSLDIKKVRPFRLDINRLDKDADIGREKGLMEYSYYDGTKVHRKTGAAEFNEKDEKRELVNANWVAFRNKYYAIIFEPDGDVEALRTKTLDSQRLEFTLDILEGESRQNGHFSARIFAGPQLLPLLKSYEGSAYDKLLVFFKWGPLDGVAKVMLRLLGAIHSAVPNWGMTIIILAVALNLLTYPLILNQMKTARKMQALQPKITQLKDKYHKNPQKMQKEQMELFRKHKVNPLGGCLPILLQMPIFIALYQVLWRSVFFNGAGFLWIADLSQPDRLFLLPFYVPLMGNEINLLPLIMGGLMFVQQRFSSKNMTVTDPVQVSQQKMMMILFPIMMLVFFYKAASGLTLYFVVLYLFMTVTQVKLAKMPKVEVL